MNDCGPLWEDGIVNLHCFSADQLLLYDENVLNVESVSNKFHFIVSLRAIKLSNMFHVIVSLRAINLSIAQQVQERNSWLPVRS